MKSRTLVCALAAASLGFASLSFAQTYDRDRGDNNRQGWQQRDNARRDGDRRNDRGDRREMGSRGDYRDGHADRYYYNARGPEWRRGGYVPREYRGNQYVVNDWRGHHLYAPPRGQRWVQVGGDYVLVAIATGVIVQLMLDH
jgi:Ni/Co efflux regulator RcnB